MKQLILVSLLTIAWLTTTAQTTYTLVSPTMSAYNLKGNDYTDKTKLTLVRGGIDIKTVFKIKFQPGIYNRAHLIMEHDGEVDMIQVSVHTNEKRNEIHLYLLGGYNNSELIYDGKTLRLINFPYREVVIFKEVYEKPNVTGKSFNQIFQNKNIPVGGTHFGKNK
jgi:hypothetical protein